MQVKLDYLAEKLGSGPLDPDMSDGEFRELRDRVGEYLQAVNDR